MKNIIDYSKTNLYTFSEKRFNNVDSLILSQLSYINFDNLVGSITANKSPITFKDLLNPKYFNKMFKKYKIKTFDTSYDREKVLNSIIDNLDDLENK